MKNIFAEFGRSVVATVFFAVILCGLYPLVIFGAAQLLFPHQANGSLLVDKSGVVRGSALLAQNFTGAEYFHPRPSAAGANGFDATSSGGSNLVRLHPISSPTSRKTLPVTARKMVLRSRKAGRQFPPTP